MRCELQDEDVKSKISKSVDQKDRSTIPQFKELLGMCDVNAKTCYNMAFGLKRPHRAALQL